MRGRLKGKTAGFEDYKRYFDAEQIHKFSGTEVGFVDPAHNPHESCRHCYHWFINQVSGWTPCEIMRLPNHQAVPGSGVCRFFTGDGKTYPLLDVL